MHYPANRYWEFLKLSGRSSYLNIRPNSGYSFTGKCVAAREENEQSNPETVHRVLEIITIFDTLTPKNMNKDNI